MYRRFGLTRVSRTASSGLYWAG